MDLESELIKYASIGDLENINNILSQDVEIPYRAVVEAVSNKHFHVIEQFILDGFDFKIHGRTILYECLKLNYIYYESLNYVIDKGATVSKNIIHYSINHNEHDTVELLIDKSDLDDEFYKEIYHIVRINKPAINILSSIISKFKDTSIIHRFIIREIVPYKRHRILLLFLINSSEYVERTDYFFIFKDILADYSNDDYRELFDDENTINYFVNYISKNGYDDFKKAIKILLEFGVDFYDLLEKEKLIV